MPVAPALRLARAVPYPERHTRPRGVVEDHLRAAAALLLPGPPQALRRFGARRVARLAAVYASEANADTSETAAASLRVRLRGGISRDAAARAFALIRVLAARHLGMTPYDVQLMAAWSMLRGHMTELATGEGKTLAASLAAATAALSGRMVHVVTVNDYLAERDHAQLSPLYQALGLTTGLVIHGQTPAERRAAYACDIVYTSNKELVFDYLRDQMRRRSTLTALHGRVARLDGRRGHDDALVMRGLDFAIVDEADSVLIDEARTPLIISETTSDAPRNDVCTEALDLVAGLTEGRDYTIDRSERRIDMTTDGRHRVELLSESLGEHWGSTLVRSELVVKALTARLLFERDVHYLLRDGKVAIIDEYTGRVMADRFWNDGLHQMIETKEGVERTSGRETLTRMTFQRFFRRYFLLAGLTGTGAEASRELWSVYRLPVRRVPPNRTIQRVRLPDVCTPDTAAKWLAVADDACAAAGRGQPVLVGTRSVEASEQIAAELEKRGVAHVVLNARQDAEEAAIVAQAGQRGRITVATNMAGRGTDIKLDAAAREAGGLHVILTEFHESPRVDRQLFGRSGRQGQVGSVRAIVCVDDALFKPLPAWLKTAMRSRQPEVARRALRLAVRWAQQRAEKHSYKGRMNTLRQDRELHRLIGFAGWVT